MIHGVELVFIKAIVNFFSHEKQGTLSHVRKITFFNPNKAGLFESNFFWGVGGVISILHYTLIVRQPI